ncbi:MAG: ribonuclease HII [Magnetococcales bacterium]|nr:ribonuclease HII [Magnetococcales bacterium]MBF0157700.1 ribonuclease HII [Magnetococcales bacterium]
METELLGAGFSRIGGIDEAGRGPLAGPVVAAAVILPPPPWVGGLADLNGIDDSKRLSPGSREALHLAILRHALAFGIGQAEREEIDARNILQATLLAMSRAVDAIAPPPQYLLVDGRQLPPSLPCPARAVVGGDRLSLSVAAASIVAKVTRDRMMRQLAERYPGYGWESNFGYPTREHRQALLSLGVTPEHRRSYAPVREALSHQGLPLPPRG